MWRLSFFGGVSLLAARSRYGNCTFVAARVVRVVRLWLEDEHQTDNTHEGQLIMTHYDSTFPAGQPCWADAMVTDLAASQNFYTSLFGWEFAEGTPEFGNYSNALLDGRTVAALAPKQPHMQDVPTCWTVYLATDDVEATGEKAIAAGAKPVMDVMQVGTFGTMGLWSDPAGAVFGAWQGQDHHGFQVAGEPGSMCWFDVMSHDIEASKTFYREVFGYEYTDMEIPGMTYFGFAVGEERPGGIGEYQPEQPEMPAMWSVCVATVDVDETAAQAEELGGKIMSPPADFPYGRMAMITGLDGEIVGLYSTGDQD